MTREETSRAIYADTSTGMRSISDSDLHDAIRYVGPGFDARRHKVLCAESRRRLEPALAYIRAGKPVPQHILERKAVQP